MTLLVKIILSNYFPNQIIDKVELNIANIPSEHLNKMITSKFSFLRYRNASIAIYIEEGKTTWTIRSTNHAVSIIRVAIIVTFSYIVQ